MVSKYAPIRGKFTYSTILVIWPKQDQQVAGLLKVTDNAEMGAESHQLNLSAV